MANSKTTANTLVSHLFSYNLAVDLEFLKRQNKYNAFTLSEKMSLLIFDGKQVENAHQRFAFLPALKTLRNAFHIFQHTSIV